MESIVYKDLPTHTKSEITRILESEASSIEEKKTALFSANMFHDLAFSADCALSALRSNDQELCRAASDVLVVIMQTRRTNQYTDQFLSAIESAQERFPAIHESLSGAYEDILDFSRRFADS